ncbi:hypothetical protein Tco_0864411 [Tanacetum coccineum]
MGYLLLTLVVKLFDHGSQYINVFFHKCLRGASLNLFGESGVKVVLMLQVLAVGQTFVPFVHRTSVVSVLAPMETMPYLLHRHCSLPPEGSCCFLPHEETCCSLPPEETCCSLPPEKTCCFLQRRLAAPYLLRRLAAPYLLRRLPAPYHLRRLAAPYLLRRHYSLVIAS